MLMSKSSYSAFLFIYFYFGNNQRDLSERNRKDLHLLNIIVFWLKSTGILHAG